MLISDTLFLMHNDEINLLLFTFGSYSIVLLHRGRQTNELLIYKSFDEMTRSHKVGPIR